MGLYRVQGKVARIAGKPFNDPACCWICTPSCCCPPPSPLPATLDADQFPQQSFELNEVPAGSGECRRFEGQVDLSATPGCGVFQVRVVWPEGCTTIDQVQVYYFDVTWVLMSKDVAVCTPFCIQGTPTLPGCATNTLLTLGCVTPPECCCPPPDPFWGTIQASQFPAQYIEMTEVSPEAGECRRYEGQVDLSGVSTCGLFQVRVRWLENCTDLDNVIVETRLDTGPWSGVAANLGNTCEPFCFEGAPIDELCMSSPFLRLGCGITPPPPTCCCSAFETCGMVLQAFGDLNIPGQAMTEVTPEAGECKAWEYEADVNMGCAFSVFYRFKFRVWCPNGSTGEEMLGSCEQITKYDPSCGDYFSNNDWTAGPCEPGPWSGSGSMGVVAQGTCNQCIGFSYTYTCVSSLAASASPRTSDVVRDILRDSTPELEEWARKIKKERGQS